MVPLKSKEFLNEIATLKSALIRDIEAHSAGIDASPTAIKLRRKRVLSGDYEFFAYTYFPHHIRGTPSQFQKHFCTRFPQLLKRKTGATEWWIAPRGEAKSSLSTKIAPIYCAIQALLHKQEIQKEINWRGELPQLIDYIIVLGAETRLPAKLLEVVKTELTVNSALALDFPEVCGRSQLWRIGEFVTKNGVKIESFGAEQAVRGTFHGASRPGLLLGDDLITDAEAKSKTERDNRWNWINKAIEYLGPPDGSVKYVGVGTVLNQDDPISRAKRTIGHIVHHFRALQTMPLRTDLWEKCQELMLNDDKLAIDDAAERGVDLPIEQQPSYLFYLNNKTLMDEGAVVSWPSVRPLFWLMYQRAKSPSSFASEMQGDGRSDEDRVFSKIHYWVHRANRWLLFGACDPSMGKGQKSDPSALLVGGYDTLKQQLNVIDARQRRRLPSKLEYDLIEMQREYNCIAWAFENNNAYEHSRQTFIDAGLRARIVLPLFGITNSVPLEVRVDALEPFVTDAIKPRILFNPNLTLLIEQLTNWPEPASGHHYDGLSALELLWRIASTRGRLEFDFTPIITKQGMINNNSDYDSDDDFNEYGGVW